MRPDFEDEEKSHRDSRVKKGYVHGETDEFSYNVVKDPVSVNDLPHT